MNTEDIQKQFNLFMSQKSLVDGLNFLYEEKCMFNVKSAVVYKYAIKNSYIYKNQPSAFGEMTKEPQNNKWLTGEQIEILAKGFSLSRKFSLVIFHCSGKLRHMYSLSG